MTKKKNPVPENLKNHVFPKGVSGNPSGSRLTTLSRAYQKQLSKIDPNTGFTYADQIAELIVETALLGDIHAIMVAISNDSKNLIQSAVTKLVEASGCTPVQAKLALSLFIPGALI